MSNTIGNIISRTLDRIHEGKGYLDLDSDTREFYMAIIEEVVDGTDTRIRLVPGYKKKLLGAVKASLEYVDQLVDQIPTAIELNSKVFVSNPYVNAFFATPRDLQSICYQSSELRDYLEGGDAFTTATCCVLLCMQKAEKTVLGMGLSNGQVRKDVMQTSVSFHDHRIYSPAASESNTRKELKCCIFQGLVTNALSHLSELREERRQLESVQQMLMSRLRHKKAPANGAVSVQPGLLKNASETAILEEKLEQTRLNLKELGLMTPQASLREVGSVLSCPEDFVKFKKEEIRLNKMGIMVGKDSKQPANNLRLTEVRIHGQAPRIVTLAVLNGHELSTMEETARLYI